MTIPPKPSRPVPSSAPAANQTKSVAGFVGAWPELPDDFTEDEATWAVEDKQPRRQRPTSMPPPIPRGTPTKPVRTNMEPSTRCIGDWQIDSVLGRGGTGTVYAVTHRGFGKRAALKLAHARLDSGDLSIKVFAREARVVQLVEHPAMPDVFATGTHAGRPYLVMERLAGETLSQRLARGAIDRTQAVELVIDICDVLLLAHDARVVHRDLKLDNVFVLDRPAAGGHRVKLLDWGFACVLGEDDPLRGMIAGALNYVAPEQVRGQPVTPATDVYSLGVLAYRLVLGEKPFSGSDAAELVHHHVFTPPPRPTSLWPEIPPALAQLMLRMLAKEPSARPTLSEVRAELSAIREVRRQRISLTRTNAITAAIALACIAIGTAALVAV